MAKKSSQSEDSQGSETQKSSTKTSAVSSGNAQGKWLVVAEKPSVAQDIVKTLGGFKKEDGYFESDSYLVTWAVGHLLELLSPEDIDAKYKAWLLKDLPILPESFQYKPKDGQKERLDVIKSLSKRKETVGYINACDAGREGELIFREVFDFCNQQKPVKRLWLQSMTAASIRKEFLNTRDGSEFDPLGDAARCRAESDWLIGMNGTRALTKRLKQRSQKGSWSVGRVQTPTLAILVKREAEILKHRPEPYWTIEGQFQAPTHGYVGQWFDPQFKKPVSADEEDASIREKEDRIFSQPRLKQIMQDLELHKAKTQATEVRKESKEIAPQLFDLTTLQREANRKFGISAARTLQAAQRLYERLKLLTYPRTDSRYLPDDYEQNCLDVLKNFSASSHEVGKHAQGILKSGLLNKDRIFKSSEVSDHFAIIPTGEVPNEKLEGDDARIFDLVSRRFLSAFMVPAVWAKVERITTVGEQSFRTRVQDLQVPGWRAVYGVDGEQESRLPPLSEKPSSQPTAVDCGSVTSTESQTKPASRVSEARLLSLMEHCGRSVSEGDIQDALLGKGIGTPATRAETIENLIIKEYAVRQGRSLRPTAKGIRLIDVLSRVPVEGLASVELTGEMEHQLKLVEKGQGSRVKYMNKMVKYTTEIVERARGFEFEQIYAKEPDLGQCPRCGKGRIRENFWGYACDKKADGCDFIVWKEKNQRYVDRSIVADLLAKKDLGEIEFFSGAGIPYLAKVIINDKGLCLLGENGQPIESGTSGADVQVVQEIQLEKSFFDTPAKVTETTVAYLCEFAPASAKAKKINARMPKTLCGRAMKLEEFLAYVTEGGTPPITDFVSKKGRPFSARLMLKSNGNFDFKFESRKKEPGSRKRSEEASASAADSALSAKEDEGTGSASTSAAKGASAPAKKRVAAASGRKSVSKKSTENPSAPKVARIKKAVRALLVTGVLPLLAAVQGCTYEARNKINRSIQNWTGTNGVVDVFSQGKVMYRFLDVEKMTTASASDGGGDARAYRFSYGVLDLNQNYRIDSDEKRVYFEVSDYSTPYIFYENPVSKAP